MCYYPNMKIKLLQLFTLCTLVLVSVNSFAQETHTPTYKCTHPQTQKVLYVLIGNEFPQIPDLGWKDEVHLATAEEYLHLGGAAEENKYIIQTQDTYGLETQVNSYNRSIILNYDSSLEIYEDSVLISDLDCIKQLGVD